MVTDDMTMKARIERVLSDTENSENRAAKMDLDDILKYAKHLPSISHKLTRFFSLLSAFHDVGVHFA